MSRKAQTAEPLAKRARFSNRARILEEVSHGITRLLRSSGKNQAWLARRLDVDPSAVSKVLEGSHNFTIETLADIGLALDRAAHLVWGIDLYEMRFPVDEAKDAPMSYSSSVSTPLARIGEPIPPQSLRFADYYNTSGDSTVTLKPVRAGSA